MAFKLRSAIPNGIINVVYQLPKAVLANLYYGFPAKKLRVVGVTGTDGKTTTVNMIYQILRNANKRTSMISTIKAEIAGVNYDTGFHTTTPNAFPLQSYIKTSLNHGDEFIALEVTSHALAQYRVWGIPFEIGVITNVTHEHLDYHTTFTEYLQTKTKLIGNAKYAVINRDDPNALKMIAGAHGTVVTYGHGETPSEFSKYQDFNTLSHPLKIKLPGDYNMSNALAAFATTTLLGIKTKIIKQTLETFETLTGRLEHIKTGRGFDVYVDFAHTPNAMKNVLSTLRKRTKKRLIVLFGLSAERDIKKRPVMGKMAAQLADIVIVTDDDPRFEDQMSIINQIVAGAQTLGKAYLSKFHKQPGRHEAIKFALSIAKPGDTIALLGKGHELSMSYRGIEYPWSDSKVVKGLLSNGKSPYTYG